MDHRHADLPLELVVGDFGWGILAEATNFYLFNISRVFRMCEKTVTGRFGRWFEPAPTTDVLDATRHHKHGRPTIARPWFNCAAGPMHNCWLGRINVLH